MWKRVCGTAMGLILFAAGTGSAQVAWDAPLLVPPKAQPGVGLFLVDAAEGGVGVLGTWRSSGSRGLGLRIGLAEDARSDLGVFGGADLTGQLTRESVDFPLDIDWVFAAGLSVGEDVLLAFPLGLTIGHTFVGDGVRFIPYVTPRIVLDAFFGDNPPPVGGDNDDLELNFAADLGVDIGFQPGWMIRFGATVGDLGRFGDRDALTIGIVF